MRLSFWTAQVHEFDQENVQQGRAFPGIFGSALTNFWCGDISEAFPGDDHLSAAENCQMWGSRSDFQRISLLCI